MSLLTPERTPVKVYRWDDSNAPVLDQTAGCVATIFKACLITGYGDKQPAGWTMPFEDTTAGVKVLRADVGPHTDFFLRLSGDTGKGIAAQVYLNMTDVNTGDLKLQCATPFQYAKTNNSGKWLLVASSRGFFFFCEQRFQGSYDKKGAHFYVGDCNSVQAGYNSVVLHHTGGTSNGGEYSDIFGNRGGIEIKGATGYLYGKMLDGLDGLVSDISLTSLFNGEKIQTSEANLSSVLFFAKNDIFVIPGLSAPSNGAAENNLTSLNANINSVTTVHVVVGTGSYTDMNLYISTESWGY